VSYHHLRTGRARDGRTSCVTHRLASSYSSNSSMIALIPPLDSNSYIIPLLPPLDSTSYIIPLLPPLDSNSYIIPLLPPLDSNSYIIPLLPPKKIRQNYGAMVRRGAI
jgi:hypothetical protein